MKGSGTSVSILLVGKLCPRIFSASFPPLRGPPRPSAVNSSLRLAESEAMAGGHVIARAGAPAWGRGFRRGRGGGRGPAHRWDRRRRPDEDGA